MPELPILSRVSLKDYNSLALPGEAELFCRVENDLELDAALAFAREKSLPVTLFGGGSNTGVNGHVEGLVVLLASRGISVQKEDDFSVTLKVAAGENWHQLVEYCLRHDWYGLENLALIPGCAGAAPIQNIGAYGIEIASYLRAVEVVDIKSGERREMAAAECRLSYRDSIFKHELRGRVVIAAIFLELSKVAAVNVTYPELANALQHLDNPAPWDLFNAVCALRKSKLPDPKKLPNAGSFFKNPVLAADDGKRLLSQCPDIPRYPQADGCVKFPAAWLIDRAGWKGRRRGAVGVHDRQALVLVHYGMGSGAGLLALAGEIAADIRQKYGVSLEMEPVVVGCAR